MEITFQNMGNNLHNSNTYFGEKQWRKFSLALLRWQMKLSEAPIFFWCGRRRRTFWRTDGPLKIAAAWRSFPGTVAN